MNLSSRLDRLHSKVRGNRWYRYFAIFNRLALAAGFIPSGLTKVIGERFTVLTACHPMGHYLDGFYFTGYYYTFVGVLQVTAAILLLIPRTATLGAFIYFPIILNICILSLAVRFDGSLFSSPLMVLAVLYLLCWDYHKWKFILPFKWGKTSGEIPDVAISSNKFPTAFFAGVFVTTVSVVLIVTNIFTLYPRNTMSECKKQCIDSDKAQACNDFCDCIHSDCQPLDKCLEDYEKATAD